jgi:negative regulator of flagellin synthesis FlgM
VSYTNGVGSPQQISAATEASAAVGLHKVSPSGPDSRRVQNDPGTVSGPDEAKLSTTASVVAQAFLGSDVRTTKVAALQQSIAAGSYTVSLSDIADKLMNSLLY